MLAQNFKCNSNDIPQNILNQDILKHVFFFFFFFGHNPQKIILLVMGYICCKERR